MHEPIIIFDIDGTLADCRHRQKYLLQKPKNWKSFFAEALKDEPVKAMQILNQSLAQSGSFSILLCTGRPESMRRQTEEWLKKHSIIFDGLLMRPEGDHRQDYSVKSEMLAGMDKKRILFVIDDRRQAVEMWRREGLLCLQCDDGDY